MVFAKSFVFIFLLVFMCSFKKTIPEKVHSENWKIVWQDEFNYSGLPNPKKWSYETGHVRNEEKQYYTSARNENICAVDGNLIITGKKEKFCNELYKKGSDDWRSENEFAQYTSASIYTKEHSGWRYGKIEIRAKLPTGKGMWPAIWMMGTNHNKVAWPACGEIDIMEYVGSDPEHIHGSLHFPYLNTEYRSSGDKLKIIPDNDFHIYAVEWDRHEISFFRDGIQYHRFAANEAGKEKENPFRKPFYLKINLAMGSSWPGPIDDKALPQNFVIDYVRVYKKANT